MAINSDLIFKESILIRETEKTLLDLFSKGKLNGTIHTCIGQEYIGALLPQVINSNDVVFSNHRGHGHYIGKTNDVEGLLLEVMGSESGAVGGVGGTQHLYNKKGFFSNGILAGMSAVAAGYAFAIKKEKKIVIYFLGDGALGEGILYEALNLISKFNLPMVIILEDNKYSQTTPSRETFFGNIKKRVEGFGIKFSETNIWDLNKLINTTIKAFEFVKKKKKPIFIHIKCYRLMAHSKGDDIRDKSEIQKYYAKDPINIFKKKNHNKYIKFLKIAQKRIAKCLDTNKKIYNNPRKNNVQKIKKIVWKPVVNFCNERINTCIYNSIKKNMKINKNILLFGEDIEFPYGGAFNVTQDLSHLFKGRVFNMPDSEAAIIGFGNGVSLANKVPICEIMFGDFMGLTFDQWLNHASKFYKMYNKKINNLIIVRTPMGGKRGYGPTHSQNLEKHFLGIPNTNVIAINFRYNPEALYNTIIKNISQPTLIIEDKLDYSKRNSFFKSKKNNFNYLVNNLKIPDIKLHVSKKTPDISIVCWGGTLSNVEILVEELLDNEEILCEVIVIQQLYPLNTESIIESVNKTKRIMVIDESSGSNSLGSEIISQLNQKGLLFKSKIIFSKEDIIPSSKILEKDHYPNNKTMYNEVKNFFLAT
jgi:2-oxoisovalerate dehydrogenase E1 component